MTTTEIAVEHGVSRQTIHTYRRTGAFPRPVDGEGSTRPRFRADEVAAFFAANPPSPGKRTDLASQHQQGEPAVMKEQAAARPLSAEDTERLAMMLSYQSGIAAQTVGLSEERGEQLARAVVQAVQELAAEWAAGEDG